MNHALKEWAIAIDALTAGKMIVLLRKGGIREQGGFTLAHRQVWLYPTYEHQKPHLLKPPFDQQVNAVASGWHPSTVPIHSWAVITHLFEVSEASTLEELLPFHIWNEQFVAERFRWKPKQPLSLLLLRVHKLSVAQEIPYRPEYGSCKSWIDLSVDLREFLPLLTPVLRDEDYANQVATIQKLVDQSLIIR